MAISENGQGPHYCTSHWFATSTPGFLLRFWAMTQNGEDVNEETGNENRSSDRHDLKICVVVSCQGSSQNLEGFWAVGHALAVATPPL